MPSLFASALSRRDDMLVFTGEAFTVAVYQAPLLDLAKIARVRADLSGWVDRDGLHLVRGVGRDPGDEQECEGADAEQRG